MYKPNRTNINKIMHLALHQTLIAILAFFLIISADCATCRSTEYELRQQRFLRNVHPNLHRYPIPSRILAARQLFEEAETLLQLEEELIDKAMEAIDHFRKIGREPMAKQLESFLIRQVIPVRDQIVDSGCENSPTYHINPPCSNLLEIVRALRIELEAKINRMNILI